MTRDDRPDPHEQHAEPDAAAARKERVLHTRVPAVLEQELKRLAQSWRVPVSNVVRTILEDAVEAVDMVGRRAEGDLHRVMDRLAQQRLRLRAVAGARESSDDMDSPDSTRPQQSHDAQGEQPSELHDDAVDPLEGVIGYQPLVLARSASCAACARVLDVGEQVFLGVRDEPGPRVLIGAECLPRQNEKE